MQTNIIIAYNSTQQLRNTEEVIYEVPDPPVAPHPVTPHETRKVQFSIGVFEIVAILALTLAILSLVLVLIQLSNTSIQQTDIQQDVRTYQNTIHQIVRETQSELNESYIRLAN